MAIAKSKTGQKVITPRGRLSFNAIFAPDTGQYANPKTPYYAEIIFPKDDAEVVAGLKAMKKACLALAQEAFGKTEGITLPFRDGADKADKYESYANAIFIRAKSKMRPDVCDSKVVRITEEGELYPGCWVRASLIPFSYSQGKNTGISYRLLNIQKIKDGEAFGGGKSTVENDFEVLESQVEESGSAELDDDVPF